MITRRIRISVIIHCRIDNNKNSSDKKWTHQRRKSLAGTMMKCGWDLYYQSCYYSRDNLEEIVENDGPPQGDQ